MVDRWRLFQVLRKEPDCVGELLDRTSPEVSLKSHQFEELHQLHDRPPRVMSPSVRSGCPALVLGNSSTRTRDCKREAGFAVYIEMFDIQAWRGNSSNIAFSLGVMAVSLGIVNAYS